MSRKLNDINTIKKDWDIMEKEYSIPDECKKYSIDRSKFIEVLIEFVPILNISNIIADYALSWICMNILECLNSHYFTIDNTDNFGEYGLHEDDVIDFTNKLKALKYPRDNTDNIYFPITGLLFSVSVVSLDIEEVIIRIDNSFGDFKNIIETSYKRNGDKFTAKFIHGKVRSDFLLNITYSISEMTGIDIDEDHLDVSYLYGQISGENKVIIEIETESNR